MRSWTICFLLLGSFFVNRDKKGYQVTLNAHHKHYHSKSDSIYVVKDLPILLPDACLGNLLTAIVKSNSNYYNSGKSFYGLILNNRKKYRYLEIFIDQWHDAKDSSYVAVIKLKNAVFLCSGDIQGNSLFHRISSGNTRIKLSIAKKSFHFPIPTEPSLQGTFSSCKGLPIYVEVYTINPISGYKMHIKH